MCAVEPIPLILETMKDPKVISQVSEARKAPGFHNYIKGACIHSPAKIVSAIRTFFPDTVLKLTIVNYALEDNPEFRVRSWNGDKAELNIILKNSNLTVDFTSTDKKYPGSTILKANNSFPLKKGDYIAVSISCKIEDKTTCKAYETCTSSGTLQVEFNGVKIPGNIDVHYMNLEMLFTLLEIHGLGQRTSSREMHWVYNTIINSFTFDGKLEYVNSVDYLQMRAKNAYLWPGDSAVLTGKFKNRNALYQGTQ